MNKLNTILKNIFNTKNSLQLIQKVKKKASEEKALTFLEIMIVLIIVGLILSVFGKRLIGAGDKAKVDLTKISLQQVKQDIEQFQLRYNALPSSIEDLAKCGQITGQGCTPITKMDNLVDAWNNKLIYQAGGGRNYRVKSLGADSKDGGEGVDYDVYVEGP